MAKAGGGGGRGGGGGGGTMRIISGRQSATVRVGDTINVFTGGGGSTTGTITRVDPSDGTIFVRAPGRLNGWHKPRISAAGNPWVSPRTLLD